MEGASIYDRVIVGSLVAIHGIPTPRYTRQPSDRQNIKIKEWSCEKHFLNKEKKDKTH